MELQGKGQISPEMTEKLATPAMLSNYIKTNMKDIEDTAKVRACLSRVCDLGTWPCTRTGLLTEPLSADLVSPMAPSGINGCRGDLCPGGHDYHRCRKGGSTTSPCPACPCPSSPVFHPPAAATAQHNLQLCYAYFIGHCLIFKWLCPSSDWQWCFSALQEQVKDTIADMEKEGIEYDKAQLLGQAEEMLASQKVLAFLRSTADITMEPYDPEVEKRYGMEQEG